MPLAHGTLVAWGKDLGSGGILGSPYNIIGLFSVVSSFLQGMVWYTTTVLHSSEVSVVVTYGPYICSCNGEVAV